MLMRTGTLEKHVTCSNMRKQPITKDVKFFCIYYALSFLPKQVIHSCKQLVLKTKKVSGSGGFKGGPIDRMHLKTGENFARKCTTLHKNCKTFLRRGHNPLPDPTLYPSAPYSTFLDPPLISGPGGDILL